MKALLIALCAASCAPAAPQPAQRWGRIVGAEACCRVCRVGKACGDSCIAADRLCVAPRGCACDAAP